MPIQSLSPVSVKTSSVQEWVFLNDVLVYATIHTEAALSAFLLEFGQKSTRKRSCGDDYQNLRRTNYFYFSNYFA